MLATVVNGYKILFLAPLNGKSHWLYMTKFVMALTDRGHEVTFITSNSLKPFMLANYTEVLIDPPLETESASEQTSTGVENQYFASFFFFIFFFNSVKQDHFLSMASASIFSGIHILRDMPRIWNPYTFEDPQIQDFIHRTDLHFDLVINEEFFGDSYLMFAHKFKAPIVTICKFFKFNQIFWIIFSFIFVSKISFWIIHQLYHIFT